MQDAFAHCAELVRAADRDRFIATLFAPADRRGAFSGMYSATHSTSKWRGFPRRGARGFARRNPPAMVASDVISRERDGQASANPVAARLLLATIERHQLRPRPLLLDLI